MLILILTDVQYSQIDVFSFVRGSNRQNHSSSGSLHPVKNPPSENSDSLPPCPLLPFGKPCIKRHNILVYKNKKFLDENKILKVLKHMKD